jgi:multidrug resistance efflux pump
MKRNRILIGGAAAAVAVLVCALALAGTGSIAGAKSAATDTPLPPVQDAGEVIADGRLVPAVGAELAFAIGGTVADVPGREGLTVKEGDVLARLTGYEQAEANMEAAEMELIAANQALEDLKRNGPVLAAEAALEEQIARRDEENARANGWDTSDDEVLRARYEVLLAKWQAADKRSDDFEDGMPVRDLALAQARVDRAQKQLSAAEAGLNNLVLRSPVSGIVVFLDVKPGQFAAPGAVVAAVADLSVWRVKTTDLSEMDISRIQLGDRAVVTFDAIPGVEIPGKVVGMSAYGQTRLGEIVYTVTVELDTTDSRMRWNMTATVKIG